MTNKPDWATRLQNTFKRKYDLGHLEGHAKGWQEGFDIGRKKALAEQRKVIIAKIQKDIDANKQHYSPGTLVGLQAAISIIKRIR